MLSTNSLSLSRESRTLEKAYNIKFCDGDAGIRIPLCGLGLALGIANLLRKQAFQDGPVSAFMICISLNYFCFSKLSSLCLLIVTQKISPSSSPLCQQGVKPKESQLRISITTSCNYMAQYQAPNECLGG